MKSSSSYYCSDRPEVAELIPDNIKNVLDIGCGMGFFLKSLQERTEAETWGVEMVKELESKARENVDHFIQGKIEEVMEAIPDHYFDCITMNDVIEHLVEPSDTLKQLRSKLKPNGILVASIPNVRYISNLRRLLIQKDWKYCESGILDSTHLRFFTRKSMKRMFEEAGYKVLYQKGLNKDKSLKTTLFNWITCFFFEDARFVRFANVVKP